VDPHIRMAGEAVHVAPRLRNAAISHQPRDLMSRLGRQRPKIPLHVVISKTAIGPAFLRANEVLELQWIAQEEHGGVVPDHVVVTLRGVELDRKSTWIAPGVRASSLPCDRRKAHEGIG